MTGSHLADLDGRRCAGESGQAGLERRNLAERPAAARVDARYTEFVGRTRQESLSFENTMIRDADHVDVLET